ncbi:MAG TPA: thiamine-phosphate kinase [Tepidisphaeraceae bacterium]|nr:thiamine-phosphate kinase [Tepidisphaeraceae bacterium]
MAGRRTKMPGEFDFIHWIQLQQKARGLIELSAGDDLAILRWPADQLLLVGVDQVMEGVHFDSGKHSPRQIGGKVMNRNLSDCAAMGCQPVAALASVSLPRSRGMEYAKEIYLGMKEAGEVFDCDIVGGETGTWDGGLVASVSILGACAKGKAVLRSGARVGDCIYVTGELGGSLLGRHMEFVPRVREGIEIGRSGKATAMIDLSDGVSSDLTRICQASGVGAVIDAAKIPIHEDAIKMAKSDGRLALEHALHDGEDYELLFTGCGLEGFGIEIGRIVVGDGVLIEEERKRTKLEARGWEHRW